MLLCHFVFVFLVNAPCYVLFRRFHEAVWWRFFFSFFCGFGFSFMIFFFLICSQISSKNVNSFFPLYKACITNPNYACALAEHADVYFYFDFFVRFVWRSLLFG